MEDLRLAIIVLGVFSILGILVHGLWTLRKNAAEKGNHRDRKEPGMGGEQKWSEDIEENLAIDIPVAEDDPLLSDSPIQKPEPDNEPVISATSNDYDEDGIGQVRTVSVEKTEPKAFTSKKEIVSEPVEEEELIPDPPSSLLKTSAEVESELKSQPKPEPKAKAESKPKASLAQRAKQLVNGGDKKERKATRRVEPKINEEQIKIDFDTQQMDIEDVDVAPEKHEEPIEQEVLVLNVKMPEGKTMSGASLLPALLTLGFKFGEQDVFHRHAASNGKGPKLFSLANMFKPGIFNLDSMETFQTQGISLFMILPIEGDPQQVFNMMHNAARKLADEFGAQILDSRRSLLTKQSLQQYVEKIREFERRRMINRV